MQVVRALAIAYPVIAALVSCVGAVGAGRSAALLAPATLLAFAVPAAILLAVALGKAISSPASLPAARTLAALAGAGFAAGIVACTILMILLADRRSVFLYLLLTVLMLFTVAPLAASFSYRRSWGAVPPR
jgi:hypothetical protein